MHFFSKYKDVIFWSLWLLINEIFLWWKESEAKNSSYCYILCSTWTLCLNMLESDTLRMWTLVQRSISKCLILYFLHYFQLVTLPMSGHASNICPTLNFEVYGYFCIFFQLDTLQHARLRQGHARDTFRTLRGKKAVIRTFEAVEIIIILSWTCETIIIVVTIIWNVGFSLSLPHFSLFNTLSLSPQHSLISTRMYTCRIFVCVL